MATLVPEQDAVVELADKVLNDIRFRGLSCGDRYLTSEQARRVFGVQKGLINAALRSLADRELLVRQRKSGTFVGPRFQALPDEASAPLRAVHVMMAMDYYRTGLLPAEAFVEGLHATLPHVEVHVRYLPGHDVLAVTKRIIEQIKAGGATEGVILIRSSRAMQEFVRDSGVPAVVFGTTYPGIEMLPWLEADQRETGRLMARRALHAGHRKFVLLTRDQWRPGDNILHEAVTQELSEAGLGFDALTVRSLPPDSEQVAAEVRALLGQSDRPTSFLCRTDSYADIVADTALAAGLNVGRNLDIVSGGHMQPHPQPRYATVTPVLEPREQVARLGEMLGAVARGERTDPEHVLVGVQIQEPQAAGGTRLSRHLD